MKTLLWLSLLLLVFSAAACSQKEGFEITSVKFTSRSGPLPDEFQWHQEILITTDRAVLTRRGFTDDTMVNPGTWEVALDEASVMQLFEQLQSVNCLRLRRVESKDPEVGGNTYQYTITYANGKACKLYFDAGTSIPGSEPMVKLVNEFIRGIGFQLWAGL